MWIDDLTIHQNATAAKAASGKGQSVGVYAEALMAPCRP